MKRRIAIVPARGGSKRIPNKNIRDFCGKPMISHILSTARATELFDVIHVSSDSAEVLQTVAALGYRPEFPRPTELAHDSTPIFPVLRYVLEEYRRRGREFEQVCLLYACAPLVEEADLRSAAAMHDELGGNKVVVSVTKFSAPIEWAYQLDEERAMTPVQPGMFNIRSQDLPTSYHDTGSFAFFSTHRIFGNQPHDDRNFYGFPLPRHKAVDIDDNDDWKLAEILYYGRSAG